MGKKKVVKKTTTTTSSAKKTTSNETSNGATSSAKIASAANGWGCDELAEVDDEVLRLCKEEKVRQMTGLEFIASENFTSRAVMQALSSCLTNKYAEGLPGARYYGGNEVIDKVEILCQQRALECFGLSKEEWGVNVQPYSGSPANFAALTALLNPHDRLMGLDLPSGGHLTHGYYTSSRRVSATSIYFESMPYKVDQTTGLIDYDGLEATAKIFRPKLIIGGASAYARDWDFARMRQIADDVGAYLLVDMAHVSGLVAAGEHSSPFPHADVVTTTTHKSLRGPRSGLIFFRRGRRLTSPSSAAIKSREIDYSSLEERINFAVFPSLQGGPHENVIAAVAVALKEATTDEFRAYARQVRVNARALATALIDLGYKVATDGTDNHIVLWDLRAQQVTGSKMEKLFEKVQVSVNKNTVPGDTSALNPGGIRLGTPAMTSRGMLESDMKKCAEFFDRAVKIALQVQKEVGKQLKDFTKALDDNAALRALAADVNAYASTFPMPGQDDL